MRITNNMAYRDFLNNLTTNTNQVQKSLNQLSSLKKINRTSDDPLNASRVMNLTSTVAQNKSYSQTITEATSFVNTQDSALGAVNDSLLRIRSLIQSSANSTQGADELAANKAEISQSIGAIVDSLNTNFDGRYIFGGSQTTTRPFETVEENGVVVGLSYKGNSDPLPREIANGVTINLPTDGSKLMGNQTTGDLNGFFHQVMTALDAKDHQTLGNESLTQIDQFRDTISNQRTTIGAVSTRLESAGARNDTEKNQLQETLSLTQDVDVAETYMTYQNQMTAYRATLAMGTKIMQTSILDYIR